jgi:hypothetical protein
LNQRCGCSNFRVMPYGLVPTVSHCRATALLQAHGGA